MKDYLTCQKNNKNFILWFLIFICNSNIFYPHTLLKPQIIMESNKIDADKTAILETALQLTKLMIAGNTLEMNKILDANFTLTHITGYVQSKEEWFLEIESERMKYYSYSEVKTSVNIDGDKAVFMCQNLLNARIWGMQNNWRLQQIMNFEKRNGKWIILKSVATTF